jgi:hypothetical protein
MLPSKPHLRRFAPFQALASVLPAALLATTLACSPVDPSTLSPDEARREIASRDWQLSPDELEKRVTMGDREGVLLYLAAGVDPDTSSGRALGIAAARGWPGVVRALLEAGADPNLGVAAGGQPPLVAAAMNGGEETLDALLAGGADPDGQGPGGTPVLMFVKDLAIADKLLGAGADPNVRDANGQTPLMAAVVLGDQALVELLLASNADPNLGDVTGRTPLLLAKALAFDGMVDRLRAAGAEPLPPPRTAAAELALFAGRYRSEENPIVVTFDRGKLYLVEETSSGGIYEAELLPLAERTFYRDRDPGARTYRFELDEQGEVVGLRPLVGQGEAYLPRLHEAGSGATAEPAATAGRTD